MRRHLRHLRRFGRVGRDVEGIARRHPYAALGLALGVGLSLSSRLANGHWNPLVLFGFGGKPSLPLPPSPSGPNMPAAPPQDAILPPVEIDINGKNQSFTPGGPLPNPRVTATDIGGSVNLAIPQPPVPGSPPGGFAVSGSGTLLYLAPNGVDAVVQLGPPGPFFSTDHPIMAGTLALVPGMKVWCKNDT